MTDYDITPVESSTPHIRLYGNALEAVPRRQRSDVASMPMAPGVDPAAEGDGVAAATIEFRGVWINSADPSQVSELKSRLRTLVNDGSISDVNVQAVDSAGENAPSRLNGTYVLSDQSEFRDVTEADEYACRYTIKLTEKNV